MCLYTNKEIPLRAKEDLKIIKMLDRHPKTQKVVTPLLKAEVDLSVLPFTFKASGDPVVKRIGNYNLFCVERGFIHCYKPILLSPILQLLKIIKNRFIVEGYIPKGTLYYEDHEAHQYAATEIVITKIHEN